MRQLIKRFSVFVILFSAGVIVGWVSWCKLLELRNPDRALIERLIYDRLGSSVIPMTPEQQRLVRQAMECDPLEAALAAQGGGWPRLKQFVADGPDEVLKIQRLALDAGLRRELDREAAIRFSNNAFTDCVFAENITPGPGAQSKWLKNLDSLSPNEYRNVAVDPSYLTIAPKLTARHRTTFRDYQDVLSPLIAAADQQQWAAILDKFEKALPRVGVIARDTNLGLLYATVYMLHPDLVDALKDKGFSEHDALDFVGANAAIMGTLNKPPDVTAKQVSRLRETKGPDGEHTLFSWACSDPAIYWLVVESERTARSEGREDAFEQTVAILNHYAGTAVPEILTKYADIKVDGELQRVQNEAGFRAALGALQRFDNFDSPDPDRKSSAARFLNYYQDDEAFKSQLAKHGARLVPALSAGKDVLAAISRNPNDIGKYVTADGEPITGKPWWTWVPGGSVAYLGNELYRGRTVESWDWVMAGADVLVFVPVGKTFVPICAVAGAGKATPVLTRATVAIAEETAAKSVGRSTLKEVLVLLRNAGIQTSKTALNAAMGAGKWAANNPMAAGVITTSLYCTLYPVEAERILRDGGEWVRERLGEIAKRAGTIATGVPGDAIAAIWDKARQLADQHPMGGWLFYSLAAGLTLLVVAFPFLLLKCLLPEVFHLLFSALRLLGNGAARLFMRLLPRRQIAR